MDSGTPLSWDLNSRTRHVNSCKYVVEKTSFFSFYFFRLVVVLSDINLLASSITCISALSTI
jgi:hypothetical protein